MAFTCPQIQEGSAKASTENLHVAGHWQGR